MNALHENKQLGGWSMTLRNELFRSLVATVAFMTLAGCSSSEKEPAVTTGSRAISGPPRHWDIGDQTLKHKLPDDISDGYLQFARTSDMSYGIMLAHDRISARSHANADMLLYIHAGTARFHIDDKDVTSSMGDLIFIPRGTVYSVESLSNRQLQFVTVYTPPLDSMDVIFHEAAERVKTMVPRLPLNSALLDTVIKLKPADAEKMFEQMSDDQPLDDNGDEK